MISSIYREKGDSVSMNLGFKVICKMIPSKKEKERKRRRERESWRRWVGKSGTICSHAGRQAVFEIGSERLQTKGEKGGRQFELVVETGGGRRRGHFRWEGGHLRSATQCEPQQARVLTPHHEEESGTAQYFHH